MAKKTTKKKTVKRKTTKAKTTPKKVEKCCAAGNICWFCVVMLILIIIFTWVSGAVWSKVLMTIFAALALICHLAGCGKKK
jgi:hypothetical protein